VRKKSGVKTKASQILQGRNNAIRRAESHMLASSEYCVRFARAAAEAAVINATTTRAHGKCFVTAKTAAAEKGSESPGMCM
jgi:hypothetical protein